MSWADAVNGGYELLGGLAILNHARVLYRDKVVHGASALSTAFFFSWGVWNLYFYPSLDQWLSFTGGLCIAAGNVLWLSLMLYYKRHPGGKGAKS